MGQDRILVGRFGAAHGVKGEVRLKSFTQEPKAIGTYGPLFDLHGARVFEIVCLRNVKDDLFVARLKGVATRSEAEALAGLELHVPRAVLPPPREDEFYFADLIGLVAEDEAGERIGRIVQVLNHGAGDMLEIAPVSGGETLLVPFTREAAPIVDVKAGHVVVVPPAESEAGAEFDAPDEDLAKEQ
ncbi:MAG: ribosome maturation factor RimM [Beijerinckiaceae bacterium]